MKAMHRPRNVKNPEVHAMIKRLNLAMNDIMRAKTATVTYRSIGLACLTLSTKFGFGKKRMERFYEEFQKEIKAQIANMHDTDDDLFFAQLEHIGLGNIVESIRECYYRERLAAEGTLFEDENLSGERGE